MIVSKVINLSVLLFISTLFHKISAQNYQISVEQDPKIETLFLEKIKSNNTNNLNDRYKIQIFSGDNSNSRKVLNDFKSKYKQIDATITFQTPNYKVLVGSFFNRIDAIRCLDLIKNEYPNSFIIKPSK
jgi:hypothetical protein